MTGAQDIALVARGPIASAQGWRLENVRLRDLKDDEVRVRIVAGGICLADLHFGDVDKDSDEARDNPLLFYPRVLGHEGSGYVEAVGQKVTTVQAGDPVILSYRSCGQCYTCQDGHPAYCVDLMELNFLGDKEVFVAEEESSSSSSSSSTTTTQDSIGGLFFGQSSFASRTIVHERSVVNVRDHVRSEQELKLLAPLGCGIQTGTGTMINIGGAKQGDEVAVLGVGGVGLSAIMAAKMQNCKTIIAIDKVQSRLDLARELGATVTINTSKPGLDLVAEVLQATQGRGVHISLDTTGVQALARQSFDFVRCHGRILQNGLARAQDVWDVPMAELMNSGKQILGAVQGDAVPQDYIPKMIEWYRRGALPLEKIVRLYAVADFKEAIKDMKSGRTVKPVLVFPAIEAAASPMHGKL